MSANPVRRQKKSRWAYYRRVFDAYVKGGNSHLTFWHDSPAVNEEAPIGRLGQYYMPFQRKAEYAGPFDERGVPKLDYRGGVGLQYNPIAIAQYGLGHYNLYCKTRDPEHRRKFLAQADWLVGHLEQNPRGVYVWNHHFDWEHRELLKAPWYSALAQGQGLSVLVRAHLETGQEVYLITAKRAFEACLLKMHEGGVKHTDRHGYIWLEEVILDPPTHILNGFFWALWGVYDYILATNDERAVRLYQQSLKTLKDNLKQFDVGFWSLYEQSGTFLKMIASPFYHRLHVVQLRVMHRLTSDVFFEQYAQRWDRYQHNPLCRLLSLALKVLFKVFYY